MSTGFQKRPFQTTYCDLVLMYGEQSETEALMLHGMVELYIAQTSNYWVSSEVVLKDFGVVKSFSDAQKRCLTNTLCYLTCAEKMVARYLSDMANLSCEGDVKTYVPAEANDLYAWQNNMEHIHGQTYQRMCTYYTGLTPEEIACKVNSMSALRAKLDWAETVKGRGPLDRVIAFVGMEAIMFQIPFLILSDISLDDLNVGLHLIMRDEETHAEFGMLLLEHALKSCDEEGKRELKSRIRYLWGSIVEVEESFVDECLIEESGLPTRVCLMQFVKSCTDRRLVRLGLEPMYNEKNPYPNLLVRKKYAVTNAIERLNGCYQADTTEGARDPTGW